jgi:MFS superfamily sulfate permease-like transporter
MNEEKKAKKGNSYGLSEWAGAFGDLGTFIPFFTGYVVILGMNPSGILLTFGLFLIISGLYFKTPFPVQPMKAIGAAAIASAGLVTPNMVWVAGLFSGLLWLILGLTKSVGFISKIAGKPVIKGIVLGLGISFMIKGTGWMSEDFLVAAIALVLAFALFNFKRIPAMFALLIFGLTVTLIQSPETAADLIYIRPAFNAPTFALQGLGFSRNEILTSIFILAIPQLPLTLGNAVIATTTENNRLFPNRPISEKKVAVFKGIMNLTAPIFGGIPMCHGAGGLAAHTRFGARSGGAVIILGSFFLISGLFFAPHILLLFLMIPPAVLGVILFFAGLELAGSARNAGPEKSDFYILLITAGFSLWNVGLGFLIGLIAQELNKRKLLKL